ncbi:3'-5' exonuclease family protein [Paraburkholderia bannensis]|uniref:3'-5' exoribonuclease n=1 Tax=Paraburkholderia bannensis TaxID=765414 RepID=UPI002AB61824|nr:3'-5' exoribonuclease [Paraburkholderia bannensis]
MTDTQFHGAQFWPLPDEPRGGGWNNRYFIDTEFTDFHQCQLISLAVVGENGYEFYGERTDFDDALCSDFVRAVVLPQLGRVAGCAMSFAQLREALRAWLGGIPGQSAPVLCYDYETDLNLFRYLLGSPLPPGWRAANIAGVRNRDRRAAYYAKHGGEHHALHDARANAYACAG